MHPHRRTNVLLAAALSVPLTTPLALATDYTYSNTSVDLAATPYTADDRIFLNTSVVSASSPATLPVSLFRFNSALASTFTGDQAITLSGPISGTGFNKSGAFLLTLAGDSPNYNGPITLYAGTLRLAHAAAIGLALPQAGPSTITLNAGGTLDLNGFPTHRPFAYNGGAVINDNTTTPVEIPGDRPPLTGVYVFGGAGSLTVGIQLFSSGSFTKIGPGTTTLTNPANASNYSGTFHVSAGTLRLASQGAFGNNSGTVHLNPTGTLDLNGISPVRKYYHFNGGALANNNTSTPVSLTPDNFPAITATGSITFGGAGDISLDTYLPYSTLPLIKTGAGTLTLNYYTASYVYGGAQVQQGTLRLGGPSVLPAGTTSVLPGGALDVNGLSTFMGQVSFAGGDYLNNNLATPVTVSPTFSVTFTTPSLRFGGAGSMTLNLNLTGSQSLTKVGAGTLTLNNGNSHTGGTNILAGKLLISSDVQLGPSTAPVTVVEGVLQHTSQPFNINLNHSITVTGAAGGIDTPSPVTIGRPVTGTGAFNKYGTSSLTLITTLTTGPLRVHQGSLLLVGGGRAIVSDLSIDPGATLSMDRPRLFIDTPPNSSGVVASATTISLLDTLRSLLLTGRNNGDWLGTGLTSTPLATSNPDRTRALAYADGSLLPGIRRQLSPTEFVDESSILIRQTYYGDANLDNALTLDDFALVDRAFANPPANPHWTDGDFDYDGLLTQNDLLLLDSTYLKLHPANPTLLATRQSQFGPDYVAALLTSIPEPSLPACAVALFLPSRRRSRLRHTPVPDSD